MTASVAKIPITIFVTYLWYFTRKFVIQAIFNENIYQRQKQSSSERATL